MVTNCVTHAAVSGASVSLTTKGEQYEGTTDSTGAYRIEGLKPGQYTARFSRVGFLESRRGDGIEAQIPVGTAALRLDGQLTPLATIRGRVLDAEGKPAAGVTVDTQHFNSAVTDDAGEFTLVGLHPGSYTLLAEPEPKPAVRSKPDGQRVKAMPTFFPSAIDRDQAQLIAVHGGDDLSGFEIRLRMSPVYRVRGVVLDESGTPAPHPTVKLFGAGREQLLAREMRVPVAGGSLLYYLGGGTLN